jgi:hypothetical protein
LASLAGKIGVIQHQEDLTADCLWD